MEAYLEGTTSSSLAWTLHGLAVKGAYQLGLHVSQSNSVSQTDREVGRRSWHWCVMNDRCVPITGQMNVRTEEKQILERHVRSASVDPLVSCEIRGELVSSI